MKKIYQSYAEIVFPNTCVCCGISTNSEQMFICSMCRADRFEYADDIQQEILPADVAFVTTMWHFDKGGYLQNVLHQLKYHHLRGIGVELGYLLGKYFLSTISDDHLKDIPKKQPLLIPVPLHPSKRKKRGYNQARALAEGVSTSTGWEIIEKGRIRRIKKTKTQTGLNLNQRSENLRHAFEVTEKDLLKNRFAIIVDDVFTTGATTFELAGTISTYTEIQSGILTVARA